MLRPLAIQVTFRPFLMLRQELVHPKDPVLMNCRKGVVYSIPCAECPQTYIGQTVRSLDHLLHEHRHVLKNGDVAASAIAENVYSANHQVHLSKATLVDAHPHTQTSCMLESWHIQHHAPGHLQQREGHHARTLYIPAGLNIAIPFLLFFWFICIAITSNFAPLSLLAVHTCLT